MEQKDIQNRKTQKIILYVSLIVIIWGLYQLIAGEYGDFLKLTGGYDSNPQSTRYTSFIVLFLIALVMAFFSARNLLKKQS